VTLEVRPDPTIVFHSDARPDFAPFEEDLGTVRGFVYTGNLATELAAGTIDRAAALDLLDDMLAIREMEEMIVRLRGGGGYEPLPAYDYRGPTHVSIGQEASAVGASSVLRLTDNVTSSHRGHGDALAKGFSGIRKMTVEQLQARLGRTDGTRDELLAQALEGHVYRVIAELFEIGRAHV
jgi:2-oxoisovalerate dehydrogenase E1 component